jgi:hypothetical protein
MLKLGNRQAAVMVEQQEQHTDEQPQKQHEEENNRQEEGADENQNIHHSQQQGSYAIQQKEKLDWVWVPAQSLLRAMEKARMQRLKPHQVLSLRL